MNQKAKTLFGNGMSEVLLENKRCHVASSTIKVIGAGKNKRVTLNTTMRDTIAKNNFGTFALVKNDYADEFYLVFGTDFSNHFSLASLKKNSVIVNKPLVKWLADKYSDGADTFSLNVGENIANTDDCATYKLGGKVE